MSSTALISIWNDLLRKRGRERGAFTLIELVMTISVMGIVTAGLTLFVVEQVHGAREALDRAEVRHLARYELERCKVLDYDTLGNQTVTQYEGLPWTMVRTVSFVQGGTASAQSLKKITVEFKRPQNDESLGRYVTYRARGVAFGQ